MKDTFIHNAIEIVLQRAFPDSKIRDFSVKAGSANGDNYLGVMYAITAQFEVKDSNGHLKTEKKHLVLKTSSTNEARKELSESLEIFDREAAFYVKVIPELIKFQNSEEGTVKVVKPAFVTCYDASTAGSEDNKTCNGTPTCRHCQSPLPWDYILMEDIREVGGYKMANRLTGLDFDHCQLVMAELAKYHALGYAFLKSLNSKGGIFKKFPFLKESFFTEGNKKTLTEIYEAPQKSALSVLEKTYPIDSPEYIKLQKLISGVVPISCHFVTGSSDLTLDEMLETPANLIDHNTGNRERKERNQWLVLAHGDCWVNNFLFQYCGNKPSGVKLIDLQIVREICLTTDLTYFFYMSTTAELRSAHLNTLLGIYFDTFKTACGTLKVEPWADFTLENLKLRFRKTLLFGLSVSMCAMPLILLPKDAAVDLEKECTRENAFGSAFTVGLEGNHELEKRLVAMSKECFANGLFD